MIKLYSNNQPYNDKPPNNESITKIKKKKRFAIKRKSKSTEKCNIYFSFEFSSENLTRLMFSSLIFASTYTFLAIATLIIPIVCLY